MRTNILHCRPYCNVTLVRCKNKLTARLAATGRIVGGNPTNHTKRHAGKPQKATRLQLAEEKRNGSVYKPARFTYHFLLIKNPSTCKQPILFAISSDREAHTTSHEIANVTTLFTRGESCGARIERAAAAIGMQQKWFSVRVQNIHLEHIWTLVVQILFLFSSSLTCLLKVSACWCLVAPCWHFASLL